MFKYLLGFVLCLPGLVFAKSLAKDFERVTGRVVYVDDGDTVVLLLDDKQQKKIRLSSIDAPETSHTKKESGRIGQPFSSNSGAFLSSLVKGKSVVAHCFELDRYSRDVCEIFVDGQSANRLMVQSGWAWANVAAHGRYLRDKDLVALERDARASKAGLWAGVNPVEPWVWRDACWKQGRCGQ